MTAKQPTLVIVMEGGLIQDICSDQPELVAKLLEGILVIDYDTNSFDEDSRREIRLIPQGNGTVSEGYVGNWGVTKLDWEIPDEFEEAYPFVEQFEPEVCPPAGVWLGG